MTIMYAVDKPILPDLCSTVAAVGNLYKGMIVLKPRMEYIAHEGTVDYAKRVPLSCLLSS